MGADPVVRKIAALLGSDAHERQIAAAIVLGEIAARDPAVIDGLIAVAGQGLPPVQRHAVEALGRLGAKKALPAVLALVGARDQGLRTAAVTAVVGFGDDAVKPVKDRLAVATDATERRGLDEILGRVGGKDAFSALLGSLGSSDVEAAQATTLAARQRIKDATARERTGYLAQVTKLLAAKNNRSPALTAAALKILGYLENPLAVPTLLSFAKDAQQPEVVRQEALIALRFTATGASVSRAALALVDLADKAPLPLARTALYTLASLSVPPALASRLGRLALHGEPERARLAIERLGQMPGAEAAAQLASVLAKTKDRPRAEAAATALGSRSEAARALGAALLDVDNDDRIEFLCKLLASHASELATGGAAEKKIGRSLVLAAVSRSADPTPAAQALLVLARKIDGETFASGMRALAAKLRKSGHAGVQSALVVLRRLGHSADASPDDGYALASAELVNGRRDEALAILRQLLDRGYDVPASLRRDKAIEPERRYQIGFELLEQRHPSGEEILADLARDGGRGKIARMAKAKLKSAGVGQAG
jgi:HEAT repeat protein